MKIRTSGSDFHRPSNLAKGGIATTRKIKTNKDLIEVLVSGDFSIIKDSKITGG